MKKYETFEYYIKSLNRNATIYIYLPQTYTNTDKHYPVLYMHDGQNLFDNDTASYGKSWGIIDTYEKDSTLPEIIIVGIDCANGINRLDEYSPWVNSTLKVNYEWIDRDCGGLGDDYLSFIAYELKPLIEAKYRCLCDANNTAIAGSSMGGLISTYAMAKYNDIFSRFGCVSNAYFFALDQLIKELKESDLTNVRKMYMDVGTEESSGSKDDKLFYINTNQEVYNVLKTKLNDNDLKFDIIEGANHNEAAWELRFPQMINFLFSE